MRSIRPRSATVLCAAFAAFTLTTTIVTVEASAAPAPPPATFVALGDSWAAGTAAGGAPLVDPLGADGTECRRTVASYPARSGAQLAPGAWTSRACAIATSGPNTQFDALTVDTRQVAVSIGADAVGLGRLARGCRTGLAVSPDPADRPDAAECTAATQGFESALASLPTALDTSFADLRARVPAARVVVTAFPLLTEGVGCLTGAADPPTALRLDEAVTRLDTVLTDRARTAGFEVLDLRPAFVDHGVCSPEPWITPFREADPLAAGAPNTAGQDAISRAVTAFFAPAPAQQVAAAPTTTATTLAAPPTTTTTAAPPAPETVTITRAPGTREPTTTASPETGAETTSEETTAEETSGSADTGGTTGTTDATPASGSDAATTRPTRPSSGLLGDLLPLPLLRSAPGPLQAPLFGTALSVG